MDISALERALSSLEKSSESLDSWLEIWTAVVVIGVAIEIFAVFKEHRIAYRAWLRATIRSPEKPTIGILVLQLAGPALVTIGLAGELWVNFRLRVINANLRDKNHRLVAFVNQKAADAVERASANEKETALALERTVMLQKRTEKVEERQANRDITPAQARFIASVLKAFKGKRVHVMCPTTECNDVELNVFVGKIMEALRKAQLNVGHLEGTTDPIPPGITIGIGSKGFGKNADVPFIMALNGALSILPLSAGHMYSRPSKSNDEAEIIVGRKP